MYTGRNFMTSSEFCFALDFSHFLTLDFLSTFLCPDLSVQQKLTDLYGLYQSVFVFVFVLPCAGHLCSANGMHGSDIRGSEGRESKRSDFYSSMFLSARLKIYFFNICIFPLVSTASAKHYTTVLLRSF